ncbi:MAG: hypothetical protein M1371_11730 [Actinobacteria bacterium]|nr:hypothetical protein [Actinomycetota bacterium]
MRRFKDEMTKRERVELTFDFKETDRVVNFDLMHNPGTIEFYAQEKLTRENAPRVVGKAIENSLDLVRNIIYPDIPRREVRSDGFTIRYEEWTTWLEDKPFHDVKEAKEWIKRNIAEVRDWHPGEQWTFFGKTTASRLETGEKYNYRENFLNRQRTIGDAVLYHDESPVGLDTAMDICGIELFTYLHNDDPDLISEWLEALNEHEIKRVHDVADYKLSPVAMPYADIAYKTGLIFPPSLLRKEFFPRLKKLVETWHLYGIKCIFHSDGNFMEVLDDFVAAGVDGINPIEPLAGWDLIDVRKKYPRLVLQGNIDCSQLLPFGNEKEVKEAVKKAIDDIYPTGGLILGSSSELTPAVNPQNVVTMIEFARQYSRSNPFKPRSVEEIKLEFEYESLG